MSASAKAGRFVVNASMAAAALLALLALTALTQACEPSDPESQRPPAPVLTPAPQPCSAAQSPLAQATRSEARASARAQSYPFSPADGLRVAELLLDARECFSAAGRAPDAARVAARLARWQAKLERDYRGYQARLLFALRRGRALEAASDSRALLALLHARAGAYTDWLRHIEKSSP